jgi:hypothetical protein
LKDFKTPLKETVQKALNPLEWRIVIIGAATGQGEAGAFPEAFFFQTNPGVANSVNEETLGERKLRFMVSQAGSVSSLHQPLLMPAVLCVSFFCVSRSLRETRFAAV